MAGKNEVPNADVNYVEMPAHELKQLTFGGGERANIINILNTLHNAFNYVQIDVFFLFFGLSNAGVPGLPHLHRRRVCTSPKTCTAHQQIYRKGPSRG